MYNQQDPYIPSTLNTKIASTVGTTCFNGCSVNAFDLIPATSKLISVIAMHWGLTASTAMIGQILSNEFHVLSVRRLFSETMDVCAHAVAGYDVRNTRELFSVMQYRVVVYAADEFGELLRAGTGRGAIPSALVAVAVDTFGVFADSAEGR